MRNDNTIKFNEEVVEKLNAMIIDYYEKLKTLCEAVQYINKKKMLQESKALIIEQLYNVIKDRTIVYGKKNDKNIVGIHFKVGDKSLFEIFDLDSARPDNRNPGFVLFDPLSEGYKFKYSLSLDEEKVKGNGFVIYPSKFEKVSNDGSIVVRTVVDQKLPQFTLSQAKYNEIKKNISVMKEMRIIVEREDEPTPVAVGGSELPFVSAKETERGTEGKPPEPAPDKPKGKRGRPKKEQGVKPDITKSVFAQEVDKLIAQEGIDPKLLNAENAKQVVEAVSTDDVVKFIEEHYHLTADDVKTMMKNIPMFAKFIKEIVPKIKYAQDVNNEIEKVWKKAFPGWDEMRKEYSQKMSLPISQLTFRYGDIVLWAKEKQKGGETDYKTISELLIKILKNENPKLEENINKLIEIHTKPREIYYTFEKSIDPEGRYKPATRPGEVIVSDNLIKENMIDSVKGAFEKISSQVKDKIKGIMNKLFDTTAQSLKNSNDSLDEILKSYNIKKQMKETKLNEKDAKVIDKPPEEEKDENKPIEIDPTKKKPTPKGTAQVVNTEKEQIPQPDANQPVPAATPAPAAITPPEPAPVAPEPTPEPKAEPPKEEKPEVEPKEKEGPRKFNVLVQMDDKGKFQDVVGVENNIFDARELKKKLEDEGKVIKIYTKSGK